MYKVLHLKMVREITDIVSSHWGAKYNLIKS